MWSILDNITGSVDRTRKYNHSDINGGFPAGDVAVRKLTFADYTDIKQSTTDEAGKKVEKITTIQEQYDIAFAEFQKKSSLPKFQQPEYSLVAEEAPEFVKSYDDTGKLVGIDLLAYVAGCTPV